MQQAQPNIIINNSNANSNVNVNGGYGMCRMVNKWTSFLLCLFLGRFGAHKFYEGKIGMGIVYIFTGGFFGIGTFIDFIAILCKPTHYPAR